MPNSTRQVKFDIESEDRTELPRMRQANDPGPLVDRDTKFLYLLRKRDQRVSKRVHVLPGGLSPSHRLPPHTPLCLRCAHPRQRMPVASEPNPLTGSLWIPVRDGDPRAFALFRRHYSARRYRDGRAYRLFAGPGQKLVLLTQRADAPFVWRLFRETGQAAPLGVNCAVFRNESATLSSALILDAERWAADRWPSIPTLYTYVNPARVRSPNPGYCFKRAGWTAIARTARGLLILEKPIGHSERANLAGIDAHRRHTKSSHSGSRS